MKKPTVKLIGEDGNAYSILGKCYVAAKSAGYSQDKIEKILEEMKAGDYQHLLQTAMKYFNVE